MDENEIPQAARIPRLPMEPEKAIFLHLVPRGAVTTPESVGENPQLREEYDQFNDMLANVYLASRRLNQVATHILYQTVVLKDMS